MKGRHLHRPAVGLHSGRKKGGVMRARFLGCLILGACVASAALAQTAVTRKSVNLRSGPSIDYPLVMQLPPGVGVQIVGCVHDWTWCDAIVGPDRGWIYAGNLYYPYQGSQVVILGYGPTIGLPIVTFSIGSYWDSYYRARPWYARRSYWIGRPPPAHWYGPSPHPRPPGVHPPPHPRPPAGRPPVPPPPHPRPPVNKPPPHPKPALHKPPPPPHA